MKGMFIVLFFVIIFNGCAHNQLSVKDLKERKKECDIIKQNKSKYNFVYAYGECLNYVEKKGFIENEITVLLHGSWPEGMDPLGLVFEEIAEDLTKNTGITSIAIATPGYSESTSNRYSNLSWDKGKIIPAEEEFVKIIVEAISELKLKYKASKVNLFGKSSGAMLGGIIAGYKPSLIDKYILIGGSYDPYYTYKYNNWGNINPGLLTSIQFTSQIDKKAKFLLIAGEKDDKAPIIFANKYKDKLDKEGITSEVLLIKEAKHSQLERNIDVLNASYSFLKE